MPMEIAYWILMLIWLVLGAYSYNSNPQTGWSGWSGGILHFLLFALLGWRVFHAPIH